MSTQHDIENNHLPGRGDDQGGDLTRRDEVHCNDLPDQDEDHRNDLPAGDEEGDEEHATTGMIIIDKFISFI
jgi:hypothetical protein